MKYEEFLKTKEFKEKITGFDPGWLPSELFDYQKAITEWACRRGKAAIFADTGMGKTMMQLAWAKAVHDYTGSRVLIVTPLCVAQQTVKEAEKLDSITARFVREMDYENTGIFVTNFEMLDAFEEAIKNNYFDGIVIDESSILKHQDSKTRAKVIEMCKNIPYRLSCTATPSPNDFMELGSQAEFLGIMSQQEMLAMFFVHDSGETSKWRLKGHGKSKFWEWLSTWSVFIKKPSDIGFSDEGYQLPELTIDIVSIGEKTIHDPQGLSERQKIKKDTVNERVQVCADLVNSSSEPFIVWCHRNDESALLAEKIPDSVEVSGSDSAKDKEEKIMAFTTGKARVIVTKPKIAGFGMNWQHCSEMAFVGLSDSYEQIYQAIRRSWRFGQKKNVKVHLVAHANEGQVLENIQNKEAKAQEMARELVGYMSDFQKKEVRGLVKDKANYMREKKSGDNFDIYLGDCVDVASELESESIDYSIFSPPFASLYTYSNSDRDMGNSSDYQQFWNHFIFLIEQLYRVLKPGRNISVHCMNLPTSKTRDGYIGIRDFRGDVIRAFQSKGFIYHSEVCVWKDPVVAMQRTKALGLLWKQIQKDSSMSRQGIPDYVVTFRKPGINPKPISHTKEEFPVDKWQHYASPCWFDIKQSNTLNGRHATEDEDERHIAPLQLDLIQRCLELWSAKDDLVFSPFTGIGSEGFVSLQMGRRFVGSELKKSYFDFAYKNLQIAGNDKIKDAVIPKNARDAAMHFHDRDDHKTIEEKGQMSFL